MIWAFFHYVLAEFALPSGIGVLLLTASVITRRKILGIAALILLSAFSMRVVGWPLAHSLEVRTRPIAVEDCPFADVVFPLGGILAPPKNPDGPVEFGLGGPRFERAIELFSAGRARAILFSGARTPPGSTSEGELLRREAIRRGVPADAITVTGEAPNTEAEAEAYRELARRRNWKSLSAGDVGFPYVARRTSFPPNRRRRGSGPGWLHPETAVLSADAGRMDAGTR